MDCLGTAHRNGQGVEKDDAEAVKWYRKAVEAGDANAMINLGGMYQNGQGVNKDDWEAVKWYRKSADQGNEKGMVYLGYAYRDGIGIGQDFREAFKWLSKAADAGNAGAMNMLGAMYRKGQGVERDDAEAVKLYRKAADAELPGAMTNLGFMLERGLGVEQDEREAVKWYRRSADAGDARGMNNIGTMYSWGKGGLIQSASEALKWHRKAAVAGDTRAMFALGHKARFGTETANDPNEAARWFSKVLQSKDREIYLPGEEKFSHKARFQLDELLANGEITDPEVLRQVLALSKPAPKLEWIASPKSTDQEEIELRYRITDQGGGIGDMQIKVDGVAVGTGQGRDVSKVTLASDKNVRSVRLKLAPGEHDITVLAYNGENLINWSEIKTHITSTFKPVRKPQLHAVVVGIDEYGQDSLKLRYAVADARAMAEKLRSQGPKLYDRVSLKLLDTKGQTGKRAILDALESVKKDVHPEDLFVFYVAAHGIYEEPAGYYMLTSDVKLKSAITQDSLSADDLHRAIGGIGAQKKLILLDTCHSGRGLDAGKLIGKRGLDDMLMVKRLNRKSGAVVLAAAESQEQALEGFEGHGLFTYAVLEALSGKADTDKDDWISTAELQGYVEKRTLELSEKLFKVGQSATPSTQGSFEVLRVK